MVFGLEAYPCFAARLHLDFGVAAGGEGEVHEGVNGFGGGVENVYQALVGAHLKLLAAFFVDVRAFDDRIDTAAGWQRNGAGNSGASAQRRINNLFGGLVNHLVVVGLQTDTDPLFGTGFRLLCGGRCFCHTIF